MGPWSLSIHETRGGWRKLIVPCSSGPWTRRLSGTGTATFEIPLFGSGLTPEVIDEITTGGVYSVALSWGDYVAWAGVIDEDEFEESSSKLTLKATEIRAALFGKRSFFGVNQYNPADGQLDIVGKSFVGALRQVVAYCVAPSAEWTLPLELPADGSGGYSKSWRHEDAPTMEDMLADIESYGVEIDFRPYIDSAGRLWYEPRVDTQIHEGGFLDLATRVPFSAVSALKWRRNTSNVVTGVLVYGGGSGQDRRSAFAPATSGAVTGPVRDVFISSQSAKTDAEAQVLADSEYAARRDPVIQASFDLHVWPLGGPAVAAPGRLLRLWSYGSARIPDGKYDHRVIALSGDLGFKVTPEVQAYG